MRDSDGNTIRGGVERPNSWHAIDPVAEAIDVIERLHAHDLLFCGAAFGTGTWRSTARSAHTESVADNIRGLIEWCNSGAVSGLPVIPPDPNGPITMRRFRRTLAWHICRRPEGRVAVAVQYGHLDLLQSDAYARRGHSGLSVMLEERTLAIGDVLEENFELLVAGGGVSGARGRASYRCRHRAQGAVPRSCPDPPRRPPVSEEPESAGLQQRPDAPRVLL